MMTMPTNYRSYSATEKRETLLWFLVWPQELRRNAHPTDRVGPHDVPLNTIRGWMRVTYQRFYLEAIGEAWANKPGHKAHYDLFLQLINSGSAAWENQHKPGLDGDVRRFIMHLRKALQSEKGWAHLLTGSWTPPAAPDAETAPAQTPPVSSAPPLAPLKPEPTTLTVNLANLPPDLATALENLRKALEPLRATIRESERAVTAAYEAYADAAAKAEMCEARYNEAVARLDHDRSLLERAEQLVGGEVKQ